MPAPDALPPVVCAVTTRSGSGFGVFCSLRDAPCLLLPMHVLGRVEDARLALVDLVVDGPRRRVHLQPDVMLAHSPAPPEGRPPDANHMDYALVACEVPTGVPREAFRPLEASVATDEIVAGDEIFVGAGRRIRDASAPDGTADSHAPTEWRRGFVTTPPRDRAGITVRYSARTIPGWSGAPVARLARDARRADDDDPEPSRGAGRLLAVHRAGADGADGEGIAAREIARDVLETVATAGVRKAAAAGDLSAAVAELARAERDSRGASLSRGGGGGGGGGGTTGVGDGGDGAVDRTGGIRTRGRREVGDGGGGVGEGVGEVDRRASEIGEARGGDVSRAGRVGEGGDRREGRRRGRGRVRVASDRDAPGIGGHSGQGGVGDADATKRRRGGESVVVQTQVRRLLMCVFMTTSLRCVNDRRSSRFPAAVSLAHIARASASASVLRAIRTMRGTQDVSLQTRGRDFYGSLPLGTRAILTGCVGLYVLCVLVGYDAFHEVCMAPHWVLRGGEVHRVFTYAWFHGSVIHLAFNMMAFVPMATSLERLLGTVQFTHVIALFTLLTSCYHVCLAVVAGTLGHPSMQACAIGFSGVIFGVIVVDTHLSAVPHRYVFGFFVVPSQWYPLALLLFLQVLMPQVSFLGHLSGLLAGLTYVRGYLNPLLLRPTTRDAIEASAILGRVARHPAYVAGGAPANAVPGSGGAVLPLFFTGGGSGGGSADSGTVAPRQWWQMPTFARRGVGSDDGRASPGGAGGGAGAAGQRQGQPPGTAGGADGRPASSGGGGGGGARR